MLSLYLDDVKSQGRVGLVGIILPSDNVRSLCAAVEAIVREGGPAPKNRQSVELKGEEILGNRGWWRSKSPRERLLVATQCLASLEPHGARILQRVGRKPAGKTLNEAKRSTSMAMAIVASDYAREVNERSIMAVCDEQSVDLVTTDSVMHFDRMEDPYHHAVIVDAVYAVDSRRSRMIQLADLVAHVWQAKETPGAPHGDLWSQVRHLEYRPVNFMMGGSSAS
ncbi:hypothetical protein GCM10023153_24750 [Ornithinibacter aureus]|uniref:DUF3800 domain-containing protein n=1 Tax=Ornithinibacter aureus TaxID=622664 RepID=A0ABP8K1S0_9MICO|nr:DUF3800 domain-containing protein [Ornithinibacter aureus]KAF0833085.1 uncharacterized protein DUF3800 [Ornithinibacter aureus]